MFPQILELEHTRAKLVLDHPYPAKKLVVKTNLSINPLEFLAWACLAWNPSEIALKIFAYIIWIH